MGVTLYMDNVPSSVTYSISAKEYSGKVKVIELRYIFQEVFFRPAARSNCGHLHTAAGELLRILVLDFLSSIHPPPIVLSPPNWCYHHNHHCWNCDYVRNFA